MDVERDCLLCKHMGGAHPVLNAIPQYVTDNVDKVSLSAMAAQISDTIAEHTEFESSPEEVERHLREHMSEKKLVMHHILQDLRVLMRTAMRNSVVESEEALVIDHKACALYLDTVKQVAALYRGA
jgi:hypothetical protein